MSDTPPDHLILLDVMILIITGQLGYDIYYHTQQLRLFNNLYQSGACIAKTYSWNDMIMNDDLTSSLS
jgi:hypothetical protein